MTTPYLTRDFPAVDETEDVGSFVRYLDAVTNLDAVRRYKLRTFELLGVHVGDRVLDLGCGNGDDVRELAEVVGPLGVALGIDKSEGLIQEAMARTGSTGPPIEFCVGDAHHLELSSDSFDGCRADRTFQHLHTPDRALRELLRVTRPGGRVVVSDIDWETLVIDASRPMTRSVANFLCDDCQQGWIGRQLPRLFHDAGFVDVHVEPATIVVTDHGIADAVFSLSTTADRLRHAGIASDAEVEAWSSELQTAARRGVFFSSASGFTVCGRKP